MSTEKRKAGTRKTDLSEETNSQLIKTAKQMVRADFGGQPDPLEVIRRFMESEGVVAGPKSCLAIRKYIERQIDACRKRQFPRLDEVIRRIEGTNITEEME